VDVHLMRVGRAEYWVHLGEMSRRVIWEGEHILYNLCLTNDTIVSKKLLHSMGQRYRMSHWYTATSIRCGPISSNSSHIYVRMLQYMSLCQCPQAVGLCC
jgi:hypothetical protein